MKLSRGRLSHLSSHLWYMIETVSNPASEPVLPTMRHSCSLYVSPWSWPLPVTGLLTSVTMLTPSPHHPHLQIREVEAKGWGIPSIYRAHQHPCVGWMRNRTGQRQDDCAHGLSDEEGSWNREGGVACKTGAQNLGIRWLAISGGEGEKQKEQAKRI